MYSNQNMKDSAWEVRKGSLNSASDDQNSWNSLILCLLGSTYNFWGENVVYQDTIEYLKTKPVNSFINVLIK